MIEWIEHWLGSHQGLGSHGGPQAVVSSMTSGLPKHVRALIAPVQHQPAAKGATVLLRRARQHAELLEQGDKSELDWQHVAELLRGALVLVFAGYQSYQHHPDKLPEKRVFETALLGILLAIGAIDKAVELAQLPQGA